MTGIPSTSVTFNFVPLQNAPCPTLAEYKSPNIGLYMMPISACTQQIMQILYINIMQRHINWYIDLRTLHFITYYVMREIP